MDSFGKEGCDCEMGSFDFEHCGHKQHFACFTCRKAFKARGTFGSRADRPFACPQCKRPMTPMGLLFRAPPQGAMKVWRRLEELAHDSPHPPFEFPRRQLVAGSCPKCGVAGGWDGKRCVYCRYARRLRRHGGFPAANWRRRRRA
jgi:hypothetical protein